RKSQFDGRIEVAKMPRMAGVSIYDQVINLSRARFGPDAAKHISKTLRVHLHKRPDKITKGELVGLIDWIRSAAEYLAEDKQAVDHYIGELLSLAENDEVQA